MDKDYVIGVDGGNTKTDYLLFTAGGAFVDHLRDGPCSHEVVGYGGAENLLRARIGQLAQRNGIGAADIRAGAFGLAGIDAKPQQERFAKIIGRIGLQRFEVDNDAFLGVFAGTAKGVGICSVNGTGAVAGGIDPSGARLQVGGVGFASGDDAGGPYIAICGVRAVYDSFFRFGEPTALAGPAFRLLGIDGPDGMLGALAANGEAARSTQMAKAVFEAAGNGDRAAARILSHVGGELAKSAAGCAKGLRFGGGIEVALAGSVWAKAECPLMLEAFKQKMEELLPGVRLAYNMLDVPPAAGAAIWALSLAGADCFEPGMKDRVVSQVRAKGLL